MNNSSYTTGSLDATGNPQVVTTTSESALSIPFLNRITWSAVIAGVVISVAVFMLLSVLGTAIGAGTINPLQQSNPFNGLGVGAAVWMLVSSLISLAAGAYVAGHHAPQKGGVHGLLSWAVVTMLSGYLLSTLAGSAIGAAGSAAGSVVSAGAQVAGNGIAAAAPAITNEVKNKLDQNGISPDWNGLKTQLDTLLAQSGKAELQPANVNAAARDSKNDAVNTATQTAEQPQNANSDVMAWLERVRQNAQPALAAADTEALANIIAARTGKSKAESEAIAQNYARTYQQAMAKYAEMKQQAELKARKAADVAAAAVAKTAWATLGYMLLGALVAYLVAMWSHERVTLVTTRKTVVSQ